MSSNKNIEELLDIVQQASKKRPLLQAVFKDLLTSHELQDVAQRWQIVKLLDAGEGQHDVAKKLKVGVATVSRGAKTLLHPQGGFNQLLRWWHTKKKN